MNYNFDCNGRVRHFTQCKSIITDILCKYINVNSKKLKNQFTFNYNQFKLLFRTLYLNKVILNQVLDVSFSKFKSGVKMKKIVEK